ncbi:MAG: DUF2058 family protein, partial [Gammaproteobacteria bacterium]|nr:DUF2058 family protein [Gammaproteobacteria bacterium]
MSSSLQEQLLKAGLVTEDQVKKTRHESRRSEKSRPKAAKKQRGAANARKPDARAEAVRREQEAKREQDRKLNLEREALKAAREAKQRARQFARKVCVNDAQAEVAFHFVRNGAVKRLYVTEAQRQGLVAGSLAIVAPAETHF